jgi:type II secretory pathway component PulM
MTIREAWERRSARERSVLAAGAIAVAVLLFVALAWIPLERTRARLEREVPEWRASVAALQRDADEVRRLRAMPPVATGASQPLASLAAGGLAAPPGARLTLADDRRLKLAGDDVGFAALIEWLSATAAAQGLRVESARLEARPEPGRVRAEITLARS